MAVASVGCAGMWGAQNRCEGDQGAAAFWLGKGGGLYYLTVAVRCRRCQQARAVVIGALHAVLTK